MLGAAVERRGIGLVERGAVLEALDEVGVGEGVGGDGGDVGEADVDGDLLARPAGPVDDQAGRPGLANEPQQLLVAGVRDVEVREVQAGQLRHQVRVGGVGVGLGDVVEGVARGDAHPGAVGTDLVGDRGGDLDRKAGAVLDGTAVAVGARVGVVGQELVHEVAVGGMDLDAVGARGDRERRSMAEGVDGLLDLVDLECPGLGHRLRSGGGEHRAVEADRMRKSHVCRSSPRAREDSNL